MDEKSAPAGAPVFQIRPRRLSGASQVGLISNSALGALNCFPSPSFASISELGRMLKFVVFSKNALWKKIERFLATHMIRASKSEPMESSNT